MNFVRRYRKLRNLTQVDLASLVGTYQAKLQRIEVGQKVSIELASQLSNALAVPLEKLFPGCAAEGHDWALDGSGCHIHDAGSCALVEMVAMEARNIERVQNLHLALEVSSVYRCDSPNHWFLDNFKAKITSEGPEKSSRIEIGCIEMVKLCINQAMHEGCGWLNLMNADPLVADVGDLLIDRGFGWSRKAIKAVGKNETNDHDVLLIKEIDVSTSHSGQGLDLWGICVAAAKLGVGLVGLVPLSVTNLHRDVQEVAARSEKLTAYFGRIGFRPVTDEILAMPVYCKPLAEGVLALAPAHGRSCAKFLEIGTPNES